MQNDLDTKTISTNIERIINNCLNIEGKKVLVIYDSTTEILLSLFRQRLQHCGYESEFIMTEEASGHGIEPSEKLFVAMKQADAIMCLTRYSLAHTRARRICEQQGIGFLSMPEYNASMLMNRAFLADYRAAYSEVKRFSDVLTEANLLSITTSKGTNLKLNVAGRKGNCCPGYISKEILLGSPPDIEANIAPIENRTNGTIVVDGSITDYRIGLLKMELRLEVENGRVIGIESLDKDVENIVKEIFKGVYDDKAYVIGELGVGFNNQAELCGNMLIDEGTKGCIHFGIGSNWTIGGKNEVPFHLDFVVKEATVEADGRMIIRNGEIL